MKYNSFLTVLALVAPTMVLAKEGPCDIYAKANTPCVAAHSLTRALFGEYNGNLYQVRRADGATKDIPLEEKGGYVNSSVQDEFCKGSRCTISIIYDQSEYKNDLKKSPVVYWLKEGGKEAIADKAPIYINGRKAYGFYRDAWSATGYRNNNTKGVATGDEEESMYMVVDGRHYNDLCCFNYGNAETTGKWNASTSEATRTGAVQDKETVRGLPPTWKTAYSRETMLVGNGARPIQHRGQTHFLLKQTM